MVVGLGLQSKSARDKDVAPFSTKARNCGGRSLAVLSAGLVLGVSGWGQNSSPEPNATKPTRTLAFHIDADQTTIDWTVGSTLHKVHGTFKTNGGELIADPKSGTAQGEVEIDAASGTTGDAKRDAKWQQDVLDSKRYPAIIFHPTQIDGLKEGDGEQTVQAKGTITLHGTDHPVHLTLHFQTSGKTAVVTTHFVVPYVQWGLKNPGSRFTRYDKEIAVDLTAKGTLEEQTVTPAASRGNHSN